LDRCIEELGTKDWSAVFSKFQNLRKENTDAVADMALENFVEMRDLTADQHFLFKKKVQALLGNTFDGVFNSRYEMISFSNIPYKQAQAIGQINDQITEELMKGTNTLEQIDLKRAEQLVKRYHQTRAKL